MALFILELPMDRKHIEDAEEKAKVYFASCMDVNKTIASLGAKPLLSLLKTLGGWQVTPGTGSWDIANFDIQSLIEMVHSYGMGPLFYMGVGEDEKDTEHNILQFDESGLGLARDQYLNKTIEEDKVWCIVRSALQLDKI